MSTSQNLPIIDAVTKLPSGALRVRGLAVCWAGIDRQNENFDPETLFRAGAIAGGIEQAMNRRSGLPFHYHHKLAMVLGSVEHLQETAEGLMMEAVVSYQEPTSPLRFAYTGILNKSIRGLSVGGLFGREDGRISRVDLTEISATPVPVHPGTYLQVVEVGDDPFDDVRARADLARLRAELLMMGVRT